MPKSNVPVLKKARPKMRTSRKIIGILFLLFLVLGAILFFRSQMSKISEISFQGSTYTTQEELLHKSGIAVGGSYFSISAETLSTRLKQIPSIDKVKVDKQFPGVIHISIVEYPAVAYSIGKEDINGSLQAFLANGTQVIIANTPSMLEKPILTNWGAKDANLAKLCAVLATIPKELTSDISEIVPSPTLSYPDRIKMYTRSHFEIITAISMLSSKVEYLNSIVESQQPGTLTMLDADSYVPFVPETKQEDPQKETTNQ
ncbi:cell division protein FtsQ [Paenibacillus shirakamiensis]|uniref:Cell division protein DivIB n=1 Tax=Paenibacillus shirakamiensis TaxID=1265935 RepID=A0ABS4JE47_9BACL|nr:FtsQ-type POTRA domain-containing protein [Paenibacillus shirakamiensis]MBP1999226.1 cell division protein FtsQ [Paenibacillus shirakamiensis]